MRLRSHLSLALAVLAGVAISGTLPGGATSRETAIQRDSASPAAAVPASLSLLPDGVPSVPSLGFDDAAAYALVRRQVGYGNRPAGSPQLRRLAVVLRKLLPGGRFEAIPGWPRLRNIVATLPGRAPAIVVGAHYDTIAAAGFLGANNGAAGTAIVVELARALKRIRRPSTAPEVRFVLFDGEEPPVGYPAAYGDFYHVGLRGSRADATAHAHSTRAMILLDYIGNRNLVLRRELSSTPALWGRVRSAAASVGAGSIFPPTLGPDIIDDHTPYLRAGVPAVDLIDWDYPGHNPHLDTLSAISQRALRAVGATLLVTLERWG
jgi:hypothetical protein